MGRGGRKQLIRPHRMARVGGAGTSTLCETSGKLLGLEMGKSVTAYLLPALDRVEQGFDVQVSLNPCTFFVLFHFWCRVHWTG